MTVNKRETGHIYEEAAAKYLNESGYIIVERNFRCKSGEIDIIAIDKDTLVFCEVKFRSSTKFGFPEEAVNYRKQNTIRRTSMFYMYTHNYSENTRIRFDVISILNNKIKHIKDAF